MSQPGEYGIRQAVLHTIFSSRNKSLKSNSHNESGVWKDKIFQGTITFNDMKDFYVGL